MNYIGYGLILNVVHQKEKDICLLNYYIVILYQVFGFFEPCAFISKGGGGTDLLKAAVSRKILPTKC